jgi:hypothetical protein
MEATLSHNLESSTPDHHAGTEAQTKSSSWTPSITQGDGVEVARDGSCAAAAGESAGSTDPRMERLLDLYDDSLAKSDPFVANLGIVNSELMKLLYQETSMLDQAAVLSDLAAGYQFRSQSLANIIKLSKQISNHSRLLIKLDPPTTTSSNGIPSPASCQSGQSEESHF